MPRAPAVTLSTDFGSVYTAQVLAVLHRRAPRVPVFVLADDLPAHAVGEASFLFERMAAGFPPGTVHLAVVDPGVGGRRESVAVELTEGSRLVGPNNGLLTPFAESVGVRRVVRIDPALVHAPSRVSPTFHGRDLFAPAAAALATGRTVAELGAPSRLTRSPVPEPTRGRSNASGKVVHVDRFGNLITSIPNRWLPPAADRVRVRVGSAPATWMRVRTTYDEMGPEELAVLRSSFETLEVSARARRADRIIRGRSGSRVRVEWAGPRRAAGREGK